MVDVHRVVVVKIETTPEALVKRVLVPRGQQVTSRELLDHHSAKTRTTTLIGGALVLREPSPLRDFVCARRTLGVQPVGVRTGHTELARRLYGGARRAALLRLRGADLRVGHALPAGAVQGVADVVADAYTAAALISAAAGLPLPAVPPVVPEVRRGRVVRVDDTDALDGDARAPEVTLRVVAPGARLRRGALPGRLVGVAPDPFILSAGDGLDLVSGKFYHVSIHPRYANGAPPSQRTTRPHTRVGQPFTVITGRV